MNISKNTLYKLLGIIIALILLVIGIDHDSSNDFSQNIIIGGNTNKSKIETRLETPSKEQPLTIGTPEKYSVAIIVPLGRFQDKWENILATFIRKMIPILNKMNFKEWHIFIIDEVQIEPFKRFNKGICNNIGFLEVMEYKKYDYIIFSDCDLVPKSDLYYAYTTFPKYLIHISRNHPRYGLFIGRTFGGVFSITPDDFYKCNGYPNDYYGWGGEDRAFGLRHKIAGFKLYTYPTSEECLMEDLEILSKQEKQIEITENNYKNKIIIDIEKKIIDSFSQLLKTESEKNEFYKTNKIFFDSLFDGAQTTKEKQTYLKNGVKNLHKNKDYYIAYNNELNSNITLMSFTINSPSDDLENLLKNHFENSPLNKIK